MATTVPAGRSVLLFAVLLCGLQLRQAEHQLLMALLLSGVLLASVAVGTGLFPWRAGDADRVGPWPARVIVVVFGVTASSQLGVTLAHTVPAVAALGVSVGLLVAVVLAVSTTEHRVGRWTFGLLVVTVGVVMTLAVAVLDSGIDVQVFLERGVDSIIHGKSPYGGTVANPYSPEESARFYGPDLVQGGRVLLGYPYMPSSLLQPIGGHVLGDVRLGALACLLASAVVVRRLSSDATGRVLSVAMGVSPLVAPVIVNYWIEPAVLLFLSLGVLGLRERRPILTALGTGLLFASKQYLVVALPALLVVRRRTGAAGALAAVAITALLCVPFLLTGPSGFVHDLVRAQLDLPYRHDSISLLVAWGNTYGAPPPWLTALMPIVAGLTVSAVLARRSVFDEATTLSLVVALSLLATVLLSKQAYANYFFLIDAALIIAVVSWPSTSTDRRSASKSATWLLTPRSSTPSSSGATR